MIQHWQPVPLITVHGVKEPGLTPSIYIGWERTVALTSWFQPLQRERDWRLTKSRKATSYISVKLKKRERERGGERDHNEKQQRETRNLIRDKERLKWKEEEEWGETDVWGMRWKVSSTDSHWNKHDPTRPTLQAWGQPETGWVQAERVKGEHETKWKEGNETQERKRDL